MNHHHSTFPSKLTYQTPNLDKVTTAGERQTNTVLISTEFDQIENEPERVLFFSPWRQKSRFS